MKQIIQTGSRDTVKTNQAFQPLIWKCHTLHFLAILFTILLFYTSIQIVAKKITTFWCTEEAKKASEKEKHKNMFNPGFFAQIKDTLKLSHAWKQAKLSCGLKVIELFIFSRIKCWTMILMLYQSFVNELITWLLVELICFDCKNLYRNVH